MESSLFSEFVDKAMRTGKKAVDKRIEQMRQERQAPVGSYCRGGPFKSPISILSDQIFEQSLAEAIDVVCGADGKSGQIASMIHRCSSAVALVNCFAEMAENRKMTENELLRGPNGLSRCYLSSVLNSLLARSEEVALAQRLRIEAVRRTESSSAMASVAGPYR